MSTEGASIKKNIVLVKPSLSFSCPLHSEHPYLNTAAFILCVPVQWSGKAMLSLNNYITEVKNVGFVSNFERNVFVTKYLPR